MLLSVIIMSDHRLNLEELALAPTLEKEEGEQQSEETHDSDEEHERVLGGDVRRSKIYSEFMRGRGW